jgi:hypothetical protein
VLHSASRKPGRVFTVRAEIRHGDYVRIEVRDEGGAWNERPGPDGRAHGLAIVRTLADESGVGGDALTGWVAWARLAWPGGATSSGDLERPSAGRRAMSRDEVADERESWHPLPPARYRGRARLRC